MRQESRRFCAFDARYTATAHHVQLAQHGQVVECALQASNRDLLTLGEVQLANLTTRLGDPEQPVVGQRGAVTYF